ncbi:hydroxyacid dehydrogenase [Candidatus Pacearchaeota archaeon]|nr:hydroxyacid dehydrogenase [Candidatus Pacearchaeota archaeon]
MKIAFFETGKEEKEYFSKNLKGHKLVFFKDFITPELADEVKDIYALCIFIYSKINTEILKKFSNLKYIATRSTGYDHIDLEACKKAGIILSNLPSYSQYSVAEHTFALLLALARNLFDTKKMKRSIDVHKLNIFTLNGKNLGVIGTGRIGAQVIRIAKGFGMNIIAYDIIQNDNLSKELNFSYVSLSELLEKSDIITLHVNLTNETEHLINEDAFNKMKKGSVLINTSRGKVVDTEALIKSLESGIVSAAGLDVIEGEETWKLGQKSDFIKKLIRKGHVILTPHIAYYSRESFQKTLEDTLSNIKLFIEGKPQNIVNK